MKTLLVGVDCATEESKVGLARGESEGDVLRIDGTAECTVDRNAATHVASLVGAAKCPVLIAIDAPLGWPVALGATLVSHQAGEAIPVSPNDLFRRETDRFVKRRIGQQPLDVGADRIARTAHAALHLVGELRAALGLAIPLAWDRNLSAPVSVIEVYPAATLVGCGFRSRGYKKPEQIAEREQLIQALGTVATLPADCSHMKRNADALDACICLLAAHDFLRGKALPPEDVSLARKESWIWARSVARE